MAAHRYWRLYFISNNGGSALTAQATAIAALQLCTAEGTNRAGSGTPSASSSFSGSYTPDKAFDGDASTFWNSNGAANPTWIAYDFGAGNSWDIKQLVITARNDGFYNQQSPIAFYVQYSDDGSTWTNYWFVSAGQLVTWTQGGSQTMLYYAAAGVSLPVTVRACTTTIANSGAIALGRAPARGPRKVSGTAKVDNVATAGLAVRVYSKTTGERVGETVSAGDGTWSINCGDWGDVYAVCFNPSTYKVLGFDQLAPA